MKGRRDRLGVSGRCLRIDLTLTNVPAKEGTMAPINVHPSDRSRNSSPQGPLCQNSSEGEY
jgi:hypothetical protein